VRPPRLDTGGPESGEAGSHARARARKSVLTMPTMRAEPTTYAAPRITVESTRRVPGGGYGKEKAAPG
jgi:hypothetical protein